MNIPIVISYFQTRQLLRSRENGEHKIFSSADLNLTKVPVMLNSQGAIFPQEISLSWEIIEKINASKNNCFLIENGQLRKIVGFSGFANRTYSLMPTENAPTLLVSGTPMHRIKGTNPWEDTLEKIQTIAPIVGHVLDTTTGLGYTAIAASKSAESVVTIELDSTVLEIARLNPWSRDLFRRAMITQLVGDSFVQINDFESNRFARIIHDPPMFQLAGQLYGVKFYAELYRVLSLGGRLFHYVGNPNSPSGRKVTRGVIRRLKEAGFSKISPRPKAFGLAVWK